MAFSGDIEAAVIATLLADAPLMALCPDGVFYDLAASGKTNVVIVKLMAHRIESQFDGRAYEVSTYLVKAVERGTGSARTKAAAARIDALLDGGSLTVPGYDLMQIETTEYVRYTEADPDDADARWQHRGILIDIWVAPT